MVLYPKLKRALSLALSINDKNRINSLIDTIIEYEDKLTEDEKLNLGGFTYELLIKHKKIQLSADKEQKIIEDLEERCERLLKENNNYWAIRDVTLLLIDYFKEKNPSKVKNLLLNLENLIQKLKDRDSFLLTTNRLEELYHFYLQCGFKDEANKILIKIKNIGEKVLQELKGVKISIKFTKKEIDEVINHLIKKDLNKTLENIAQYYIPTKDEITTQLKNISDKAPISFLISHKILDKEGRIISTAGSLEEDIDSHIVLQIAQNMKFDSFLLRETINAARKKFDLNTEKLIRYLYKSPIFDERRKEFFIQGIKAYLNNQCLIALHILIPQIESLIRNLAEKIELPIFKTSRLGGFNYKTLDDLLRDKNLINVLTEDVCLYLRVLLTDPRGWNLRNNICHGISQIDDFNQIVADRVLHALLCLSLVRKRK